VDYTDFRDFGIFQESQERREIDELHQEDNHCFQSFNVPFTFRGLQYPVSTSETPGYGGRHT
jgi:hypothetical protein